MIVSRGAYPLVALILLECAIAVCSFLVVRPADHRRAAPICALTSTISPSAETAEEQELGTLQSGKFKKQTKVCTALFRLSCSFRTCVVASVSRISVCAAELCQCQGDFEWGGASDHAIETLKSLDLPFDVDEVGCLGACGIGTAIAVDFRNGDSFVLDGLESTLLELGLETKNESVGGEQVSTSTETSIEAVSVDERDISVEGDEIPEMTQAIGEAEGVTQRRRPSSPSTQSAPVDVRERMRQAAAEEVQNPWMNMAAYLFKKAVGSDDR